MASVSQTDIQKDPELLKFTQLVIDRNRILTYIDF